MFGSVVLCLNNPVHKDEQQGFLHISCSKYALLMRVARNWEAVKEEAGDPNALWSVRFLSLVVVLSTGSKHF